MVTPPAVSGHTLRRWLKPRAALLPPIPPPPSSSSPSPIRKITVATSLLLQFPDHLNSPGHRFWMGWWGYAKRQEFTVPRTLPRGLTFPLPPPPPATAAPTTLKRSSEAVRGAPWPSSGAQRGPQEGLHPVPRNLPCTAYMLGPFEAPFGLLSGPSWALGGPPKPHWGPEKGPEKAPNQVTRRPSRVL